MNYRGNLIVEACERALDQWIAAACDGRLSPEFRVRIPVPGGGFIEPPLDAKAVRSVGRALAAVEWHEKTAPPSWACPLPLRLDQCESMICNANNALQLVGYFGRSMRWSDWDIDQHPTFDRFCCGVMDYMFAPMELRTDKELQQMFPPRALAGLKTPLCWRQPAA